MVKTGAMVEVDEARDCGDEEERWEESSSERRRACIEVENLLTEVGQSGAGSSSVHVVQRPTTTSRDDDNPRGRRRRAGWRTGESGAAAAMRRNGNIHEDGQGDGRLDDDTSISMANGRLEFGIDMTFIPSISDGARLGGVDHCYPHHPTKPRVLMARYAGTFEAISHILICSEAVC